MKKITIIIFFSALLFGVSAQTTSWSLTGNAGTNTRINYLGTSDCEPLIFKTNNIERMRLKNIGTYLGIGTPDPKSMLHLHSTNVMEINCDEFPVQDTARLNEIKLLQLTTYNALSGFNMYFSKNNFFLKHKENTNFFIEGLGGGLMIAPNGNVGIGTDIPKQKLHIIDGNILISKTSSKAPGSLNGSILFGRGY